MESFLGKRILHSGRLVDVFDLKPEDIDVRDIAHALSMICRFGGHTPVHYSVAEHSLNVAMHCPGYEAYALLHDAAEAYIGDYCATLKPLTAVSSGVSGLDYGYMFGELEGHILARIFSKFGLVEGVPEEVHEADRRMLSTEAVHFFGDNKYWHPWETVPTYPDGLARPLFAEGDRGPGHETAGNSFLTCFSRVMEVRLCCELQEVRDLMLDGLWRTVREIHAALEQRCSETGISARLRDLRKECFGAYRVEKRRRGGGGGLWEYQVLRNPYVRS